MVNRPGLLAVFLLNSSLLLLFFLLAEPSFYSEEDTHLLYLLSGGYGFQPTAVLHYNYLFHPLLGFLIKNAFVILPGVNWYTIFLLACHVVAINVISAVLFRSLETPVAFVLHLLLFAVFEGWLLLNFGFNSAALVLTVAGLLILFDFRIRESASRHWLILAFVLLTCAAMIRIHPLVPLLGISLPFLLFPLIAPRTRAIITTLTSFVVVTVVLVLGQQGYYTREISQWPEEDKFSQSIFRLYNDGRTKAYQGDPYRVELDLIAAGLPADKALLHAEKLDKIYQNAIATIPRYYFLNQATAYWYFVNWRLFFYVSASVAMVIILTGSSYAIPLISLSIMALGLLTLSYFQRTPEYLLIGCLFLWVVLFIRMAAPCFKGQRKLLPQAFVALLFIGWALVRIDKISLQHRQDQKRFAESYRIIREHHQFLFINVYGGLPIKFMPLFADPRNYLLDNFLGSEHFLMNLQHTAFEKYSITELAAVPLSGNVLFIGEPRKGLLNYFRYKGFSISPRIIVNNPPSPIFQLRQP